MSRFNLDGLKNGWYENLLFLLLTVWLLTPVFAHEVFFTHDGAAHLYNSQILKALITGNAGVYADFFQPNSFPEPNLTGHVLLALLLFFVKPFVAEKIVVAMYIVGFCYGFRYWVKSFSGGSSWAPFLVFPFVYSFPLYVGFFNFCLGLVLLLWISGYWLRHARQADFKRGVLLFLLFFMAYFTHISTFLVSVFFVGTYTFFTVWGQIVHKKEGFFRVLGPYKYALLALLPTLLFSATFFIHHGSKKMVHSTNYAGKWQSLLEIAPVMAYNTGDESAFTRWLGDALLVLCLCAVFGLFIGVSKNEAGKYRLVRKDRSNLGQMAHVHVLLALVFLLAYFVLPDEMASGGFVSVRLALLFFLTLSAWLSTVPIPKKILLPALLIGLLASSHLLQYRDSWAQTQNKFVKGLLEVAPQIPEGSVVMPLVQSEHWFFLHTSNYIGAVKPIVLLDNYEAETGYFPIRWKMAPSPGSYLGEPIFQVCGNKFLDMESSLGPVDFILQYNDSIPQPIPVCDITMQQVIQTEYEPSFVSSDTRWTLYRRRSF